jgi:hypothetical protein
MNTNTANMANKRTEGKNRNTKLGALQNGRKNFAWHRTPIR